MILGVLIVSCADERSAKHKKQPSLTEDQFKNLLLDLFLGDSYLTMRYHAKDSVHYIDPNSVKAAVLKKYNLTWEEFNILIDVYMKDPERSEAILTEVIEYASAMQSEIIKRSGAGQDTSVTAP